MFPSRSRSDDAAQKPLQELRELPVGAIEPNPSQPRRRFDRSTLQALADSLREHGVLQPVLVRPLEEGMYQLLAGERRWRAAEIAGLQTIPALVSAYDDVAALQVALIENMAREDLNAVEQARAWSTLVNEFGLTLEQVGRSLGRSPGTVSNLVSLLKLSDRILEFIEGGRLGGTHGTALLKAKNPEARQALALAAVRERWTLRELEDRVRASNVDLLESLQGRGEQARNAGQARELAAVNLARSWGDLLGAEVQVRPMSRRKLRLEVAFDFPAEGIALADRLAAAIARSSKGR